MASGQDRDPGFAPGAGRLPAARTRRARRPRRCSYLRPPVGAGEEMTYQTGPAGLILESGRAVLRPG